MGNDGPILGDIGSEDLNSRVAELPTESKELEPESKLHTFCFAEYKMKECDIDSLEPENAKEAILILRNVGMFYTDRESFLKRCRSTTEVKIVSRSEGDYKDLYRGLAQEIDLQEVKCKHDGKRFDFRIFFYLLNRKFYLIAIKQAHIDTSKGDGWKHKKK